MTLQQWGLPLTINVSLNGCEWNTSRRKTLAQVVFDRRRILDGVKTDQKYWCKIFSLIIDLCSGVGIVWSTTTWTWVNDATSSTIAFSVKCLNPLKLYPLSGNIFRKWFASYFLITHEHFIVTWSPMVNLIAVMTLLLTSGLHRCQQRIFKKNTDYFYAVRICILLAILSEIFIQNCYFF